MPNTTRKLGVADAEAVRFETTLKEARIPIALHEGLWDVWVDNPPRANEMVKRFKDYPATQPNDSRLKQATRTKSGNSTLDELTRALEAIADKMDRPNFDAYARPLIQQANQVAAQLDQANRAAGQRIGMGRLFDDAMKELK